MNFSITITDWSARAPGLETREAWQTTLNRGLNIDGDTPYGKLKNISNLTARRLSSGSRLALDCALDITTRHSPDAFIFTCRHGELERNHRILSALAEGDAVSPTDFTMSVHNSAVGQLAIMLDAPVSSTSISAGEDSFQQGIIEAVALLGNGFTRILLVDFEGKLPEFYLPHASPHWPYACALLLEKGTDLNCQMRPLKDEQPPSLRLPQSLRLLHYWLGQQQYIDIESQYTRWSWSR
ncbi:beta-ketoacyl synthase [Tatumella sp. TA1]|uniref:beta-ketoacyl synthase chain length factor n=1 Tax=Rosenbergiella collisarenosi TaxID=1544695 RepID=UPI0008F7E632|nr:beta-ketoacyl synthase chain length factor [Rosenbergiella collisarenosi]QGX90341.1 beta-ketoacyl synthase [Tatumella sp. TA1]